jgi:hypothetical protein
MLSHLQNLVKQGFMLMVELEAYLVPKDATFLVPAERYVVSFMAFYEWGFSMMLHRFLCSLLRYYDLKLHHLTPLGVLHIATFVTLCEAYLGIGPKLDLWKYFFRVWHLQDPELELTISGCMVIHLKVGHRIGPYPKIPMPRSMKGWWKKWFYLKNDDLASPSAFTHGLPVPLPSWGEGVGGRTLASYNLCASTFSSCGRRV